MLLECVVDVLWMGGCWWESGGEESAYEVVAAEGCRERAIRQEQSIRQKREGPSGLCLPLTPEARARLLHSH